MQSEVFAVEGCLSVCLSIRPTG